MAAESNMGFNQGFSRSPFCNNHLVSFQSGGVSHSAGMIPGGINGPGAMSSTGGMVFPGNHGIISNAASMVPPGSSSCNTLRDSMPGLKHDTGLAAEWSFDEQAILKDGLATYPNEPSMMKYIKIAAMLPNKTVRDVALRFRWMTKKESGKRRKQEENYAGKKIKDRKDKILDITLKTNANTGPPDTVGAYPHLMHDMNSNHLFSYEVPAIDSATEHLLEQNAQILNQITTGLTSLKIQDNTDLFVHARNNITTILNSMSKTPGIMSQMPPLPVSINEDLVNVIHPGTSQMLRFGTHGGLQLKQEQAYK